MLNQVPVEEVSFCDAGLNGITLGDDDGGGHAAFSGIRAGRAPRSGPRFRGNKDVCDITWDACLFTGQHSTLSVDREKAAFERRGTALHLLSWLD